MKMKKEKCIKTGEAFNKLSDNIKLKLIYSVAEMAVVMKTSAAPQPSTLPDVITLDGPIQLLTRNWCHCTIG
jgi:hypothetical protein